MSVLVVTTENVPGYRVVKVIGAVFGVSVRSRNVLGNAWEVFGRCSEGTRADTPNWYRLTAMRQWWI